MCFLSSSCPSSSLHFFVSLLPASFLPLRSKRVSSFVWKSENPNERVSFVRTSLVCPKRVSFVRNESRLFETSLVCFNESRLSQTSLDCLETSLVCRNESRLNETRFRSSTIASIVLDVCNRVYKLLNETGFPETGIDPQNDGKIHHISCFMSGYCW